MTSGIMKAVYAVTATTVVLLTVGVYLIATQASDLKALRIGLDDARLQTARKRAQLMVVQDALVETRDYLTGTNTASVALHRLCGTRFPDAPYAARFLNICEGIKLDLGKINVDFLSSYSAVVGKRATAALPSDFAAVRRDYAELLEKTEHGEVQPEWRGLLFEGMAYADYRDGQLADADLEVANALRLNPDSAFAALTELKIACARQTGQADFSALFQRRWQHLKRTASAAASGVRARNAALEVSYFRDDPELPAVCHTAKISLPDNV